MWFLCWDESPTACVCLLSQSTVLLQSTSRTSCKPLPKDIFCCFQLGTHLTCCMLLLASYTLMTTWDWTVVLMLSIGGLLWGTSRDVTVLTLPVQGPPPALALWMPVSLRGMKCADIRWLCPPPLPALIKESSREDGLSYFLQLPLKVQKSPEMREVL